MKHEFDFIGAIEDEIEMEDFECEDAPSEIVDCQFCFNTFDLNDSTCCPFCRSENKS